MPHTTNRNAFRDCNVTQPFFRLYTYLVAIELTLKDLLPAFVGNHDIEQLAQRNFSSMPSGLQAQLVTVFSSLRVLACTAPDGTRATVRPNKYPDLRYLRHEQDGFVGDSKSSDIEQALKD